MTIIDVDREEIFTEAAALVGDAGREICTDAELEPFLRAEIARMLSELPYAVAGAFALSRGWNEFYDRVFPRRVQKVVADDSKVETTAECPRWEA